MDRRYPIHMENRPTPLFVLIADREARLGFAAHENQPFTSLLLRAANRPSRAWDQTT